MKLTVESNGYDFVEKVAAFARQNRPGEGWEYQIHLDKE